MNLFLSVELNIPKINPRFPYSQGSVHFKQKFVEVNFVIEWVLQQVTFISTFLNVLNWAHQAFWCSTK